MILRGNVPGGVNFHAVLRPEMIALRVGDRTCIAAPRWLTDDERHRLIAALEALDD